MTQRDRDRLVALKKANKKLITQKQAAEEMGVSERQVRRMLKRLREGGDLWPQTVPHRSPRHRGRTPRLTRAHRSPPGRHYVGPLPWCDIAVCRMCNPGANQAWQTQTGRYNPAGRQARPEMDAVVHGQRRTLLARDLPQRCAEPNLNTERRANTARRSFAFTGSRPQLGSFTTRMGAFKIKTKTPELSGSRVLLPIRNGASPVASALSIRLGATPCGPIYPNIRSLRRLQKQDISTWHGIGHFYSALTGEPHFWRTSFFLIQKQTRGLRLSSTNRRAESPKGPLCS